MLLVETADTTTLSYWMNWRVLLCVIWVLTPMIVAAFIIWKYEGPKHPKSEREETEQDIDRFFSVEKAWRPCLEEIHPCWLLAFRIISFCFLLATLIGEVVIHGGGMFFYYTQWTFTLVTIYFGFGSLLSIYGCYQYDKMSGVTDSEQGSYMPLLYGDGINKSRMRKTLDSPEENSLLQTEAIWSHLFQVIFQVLSSGTDAHPMLCHLCTSCGNKTQPAIKMVPPILSMLKIKKPYPAQIPQKPEGVSPFGKAAFRFCLWQVDNSAMPPTPEEGSP